MVILQIIDLEYTKNIMNTIFLKTQNKIYNVVGTKNTQKSVKYSQLLTSIWSLLMLHISFEIKYLFYQLTK